LGSLRIIYATRDPALFRSRHRIALLAIAGNLIAIANNHINRKLAIAGMHTAILISTGRLAKTLRS